MLTSSDGRSPECSMSGTSAVARDDAPVFAPVPQGDDRIVHRLALDILKWPKDHCPLACSAR